MIIIGKKLFLLIFLVLPILAHTQNLDRTSISFQNDYFRNFQIDEGQYPSSSAYTIKLSYYNSDYTRLEYSGHYSSGYHKSVSYSTGLAAAYVIHATDRFSLKPGLGLETYRMEDRNCKSIIRGILMTILNSEDDCSDDVHTSINPSMEIEMMMGTAFSLFVESSYRLMLSSVGYVKDTKTGSTPEGEEYEYKVTGTRNSIYGAGLGIGIGLRINF